MQFILSIIYIQYAYPRSANLSSLIRIIAAKWAQRLQDIKTSDPLPPAMQDRENVWDIKFI